MSVSLREHYLLTNLNSVKYLTTPHQKKTNFNNNNNKIPYCYLTKKLGKNHRIPRAIYGCERSITIIILRNGIRDQCSNHAKALKKRYVYLFLFHQLKNRLFFFMLVNGENVRKRIKSNFSMLKIWPFFHMSPVVEGLRNYLHSLCATPVKNMELAHLENVYLGFYLAVNKLTTAKIQNTFLSYLNILSLSLILIAYFWSLVKKNMD